MSHGSQTCSESSGFSRNHCNFASRPCQKQSSRSKTNQACQIPSTKEAASGGFSPLACKTIVAVYVLSDCNMELSLRFAELWPSLKHMRRPAPVLVEDLFLGTTDLDLQQIFAPCETPWAQPVRHAKSFLAEANTFRWVLACNHVGVAPLSLDVYESTVWQPPGRVAAPQACESMGAALPSQVEPAVPSPKSTSAQGSSHGPG